jgi:hypothetical protein
MYRAFGNCEIIRIPPPIHNTNIVRCEEKEYPSVFSPSVWGESVWFFLHVGSLACDALISDEDAERYWNFIEGIPLMLPCKKCSVHAQAFVDSERPNRRDITKSRDSLIDFFVKFHNAVNERQSKPLISREDIERLASGNVKVNTVRYY